MAYLITIAIIALLLGGFLALVSFETRTGKRLAASARYKLDARIARLEFVAKHVDWGAFSADVARTAVLRVVHDVIHGTLVAVRTVERLLTRAVKALRESRTVAPVARATITDRARAAYTYIQKAVRDARKR